MGQCNPNGKGRATYQNKFKNREYIAGSTEKNKRQKAKERQILNGLGGPGFQCNRKLHDNGSVGLHTGHVLDGDANLHSSMYTKRQFKHDCDGTVRFYTKTLD